MTLLETERLILRTFTPDDFDAFAEIMADPEVTRYLGDPTPRSRPQAWRAMAECVGHQHLRGFSQSAVIEKATGRLLGRGGLWYPEGWPALEVGWVLGRFAWGRGYATELGRASVRYAFEVLGADEVCSLIHPDNQRSIKVAERIGHEYWGEYVSPDGHRSLRYGQRRKG